ncbi:TonB-dependent receptor plug domain-containing protein [Alteraurantiacibacter buctensis]|uniref:TonB-dependent receptor n=1 Tax=Alteraurantiacibacter buctensis TaxID=1503981 RepID=A0A844YVF2_9SPHN|nr:TonB-dependent receptor [Alteraurantiacibacter buctensis]MXO70821.1 TonB-dependent receptor [Alteraurantiacibacter buctensis]
MSKNNRRATVPAFLRTSSLAAIVAAGFLAAPAFAQDAQDDTADEDDRIIVTGSRIANVAPVGATVTALGRDEIETSGQVTIDRIIQDLPAVLDVGFSDSSRNQSGGNGNATFSNSINLRGLSPFATLIITDGHRMTSNGRAINPSVLPTLGVERIEVIADGASAIYGSDAVAGVVNLIPRRNLDGVEAFGRFNTAEDGAFHEWNAGVALGRVFDRGQFMVAYEHSYRSNLSGLDRDFATSDLRPFGGPSNLSRQCSPGTLIYRAPGAAAATTYLLPDQLTASNANSLTPGTRAECDLFKQQDLFPEQEYDSVSSTLTYEFLEGAEFIFDGYFNRRDFSRTPGAISRDLAVPQTNAFFVAPSFYVPGSGGYTIAYNFSRDIQPDQYTGFQTNWQITPGLRIQLPHEWSFEGRFGYGKARDRADSTAGLNLTALAAALASSNPATAFDPYGLGRTSAATLAAIFEADSTFPTDAEFSTWQAGVNGPLFSLPGGEVKVAVGYEGQRQEQTRNTATPTEVTNRRTIHSVYTELNVPVFGPGNATGGFEELTVTAAVRYDDYSDVGGTTNPKFGLNWSPVDGVMLRGSYGTSFRAPSFPEIFGNSTALFVQPRQNPGGNPPERSVFTVGSGPNPDLQPETSTTWTAGADFDLVDGLTVGVTYFDIAYGNTINNLLSSSTVLAQVAEYAGTDIILFGKAAYDRIVDIRDKGIGGSAAPVAIRPFPGASTACLDAPAPDFSNCVFVDARSLNLGRSQMRGIDFNLRYRMDLTDEDQLTFTATGTYLTSYKVAFTPNGAFVDRRNTIFNPLTFKSRAAVAWNRGPFDARLQWTYVNGYRNINVNPVERVSAYNLFDLNFGWDLNETFDLPGERLVLGLEVRNLFDQDPSYANILPNGNSAGGYDVTVADPIGRQFAVSLRAAF